MFSYYPTPEAVMLVSDRARHLGGLIKTWRIDRGLNRPEMITELERRGVDISPDYLNKLESGTRSLASASLEIREGLRTILGINASEWERQTGLYVPESAKRVRVAETNIVPVLEPTHTIPVFHLRDAPTGGRSTGMTTDIPASWQGDFAAYLVEGADIAGLFPYDRIIIKVQLGALPQASDLIIADTGKGVILRRFIVATGSETILAVGSGKVDTHATANILGVVLAFEVVLSTPRPTV